MLATTCHMIFHVGSHACMCDVIFRQEWMCVPLARTIIRKEGMGLITQRHRTICDRFPSQMCLRRFGRRCGSKRCLETVAHATHTPHMWEHHGNILIVLQGFNSFVRFQLFVVVIRLCTLFGIASFARLFCVRY